MWFNCCDLRERERQLGAPSVEEKIPTRFHSSTRVDGVRKPAGVAQILTIIKFGNEKLKKHKKAKKVLEVECYHAAVKLYSFDFFVASFVEYQESTSY